MMSKHFTLITLLALLASADTKAQYDRPENRIWAMNSHQGLDFTSDPPVPFSTMLGSGAEACASVSDSNGNLLFYTNGQSVWNRNDVLMPNSQSNILGSSNSTLSTTQGAVIVPLPDSAGKYYLFSLTVLGKLFCNKIDISLDNGLGDVDTTFFLRNAVLDSNLTEKMIAVAGCNNNVWLILHEKLLAPATTNHVFKAYEITAAGINLTPVVSDVGTLPSYQQGVLKVSPSRKKILACNFESVFTPGAVGSNGVEVFDFDYRTGLLSNAQRLDSGVLYYGGTFSPDNTKVYAQSTNDNSVYQFDLNAADPAQSKLRLGPSGQYADMKLGIDGKIYFGALVSSPGFNNYKYMGRINLPDNAGVSCDFQDSVTSLAFLNAAGTAGGLAQGLPNEVAVPVKSVDTLLMKSLDTVVCEVFTPITLQAPANADEYIWDDGSDDTARTITTRGVYWVLSFNPCPRIDSFYVNGVDMPDWSITVNERILGTSDSFETYQWFLDGEEIEGATDSTYTVTENGWYSVLVTFAGCEDSLGYKVSNITGIKNHNTLDNSVSIYPNPTDGKLRFKTRQPVTASIFSMSGEKISTHSNIHEINVGHLPDGIYIVRITNPDGIVLKTEKLIKQSH